MSKLKKYRVWATIELSVDVDFLVDAENETEAERIGNMLADEKAFDKLDSVQPDITSIDVELETVHLPSLITKLRDASVAPDMDEGEAGYYQMLYMALETIEEACSPGDNAPMKRELLWNAIYGEMMRCEDNDEMVEKCLAILKKFEPDFFEIPYWTGDAES